MKAQIDFSIVSLDGDAIGSVMGEVDLPLLPAIGDTLCFVMDADGRRIPDGHTMNGMLRVVTRVICPESVGIPISLSMEDMVLKTREQALKVMEYLEIGFDMDVVIYASSSPVS